MLLAEDLMLPVVDSRHSVRGRREEEDPACACSPASLYPHRHLMAKERSNMKRSSSSSRMSPHHSRSHHLPLPWCYALPVALMGGKHCTNLCVLGRCVFGGWVGLSHPPRASDGAVGETLRPQDWLVHRRELEGGEMRHH